MSDYLSIAFALLQLLLILAVTGCSIIAVIGLFHPLVFNVRLRASQLGQRAEIWGAYLFGTLKIGIVATPANQDVILKFLFWKKLLQRNRRQKVARPGSRTTGPSDQPPGPSVEKSTYSSPEGKSRPDTATSKPETEEKTAPAHPAELSQQIETPASEMPAPVTPPEPAPVSLPASPAPASADDKDSTTIPGVQTKAEVVTTEPLAEEPPQQQTPDVIQTTPARPIEPTPVDTLPLKPVSEVHPEKSAAEKPADREETAEAQIKDGWQSKFRRFRRDFNRRYRQIRGWLRTFMRKWKVLYPVFLRFWHRGKKGMSIDGTSLLLRYALHEPYLTGMFHANLAVMSGFVGRFGVNFKPVPVFSQPCIYARGHSAAVIRPWRFAAAIAGLLLEPDLYRQLWQAFKWYRARRQSA